MDQEGGGTSVISMLPAAVATGATTAEAVATSFRRLFAYRIRLGMLDPPTLVAYNNISYDVCASAPHIALAREAARKGMALYANRAKALPLSATEFATGNDTSAGGNDTSAGGNDDSVGGNDDSVGGNDTSAGGNDTSAGGNDDSVGGNGGGVGIVHSAKSTRNTKKKLAWKVRKNGGGVGSSSGSLAVVGPNAACAACLNGNYATAATSGPGLAVSILAGLRNWKNATLAQQQHLHQKVSYAPGCANVECTSTAGFSQAVALAKSAKVTVLVLGSAVAGHPNCTSNVACEGEGHDRNSTAFGGHQYELAAALAAVSPRMICIIVHGGSLTLGSLTTHCDAILDAGYPGAQGGNAIADVVFGAYGARFLRHEFALQDAIGSHACSLQPARFKRAGVRPMAFLSVVHFSYQLTL
jgi:hypothetical protein